MNQERLDRLGSIIREIIAPQIMSHIQEFGEKFGLVSLVRIQISADSSWAEVYMSAQNHGEELSKFLAPLAPRLRHEVSKNTSLFRAPQIRFFLEKDTVELQKSLAEVFAELKRKEDIL